MIIDKNVIKKYLCENRWNITSIKKLGERRLGKDICEYTGSCSTIPFSLCLAFLSYSY